MPESRAPDRGSVPPIEIGSFVAVGSDKSEFIGSASGVFFANTVFRAFAAVQAAPSAESASGITAITDPGSVHSYLAAAGPNPDHEAQYNSPGESGRPGEPPPSAHSYGVDAPGIGISPERDTATRLVMLYFRCWHPYFPFLHGPSFLNQVNQFFNDPDKDASTSQSKLCRAVTLQCVYNIAASTLGHDHELDPRMRIHSSTALTNLLGTISSTNDMATLQTLLAMELYLISKMALRAASTIHGVLTRLLYHSGFHRCPYRYVQLSKETCDIRQRIFWSAYVIDRYLGQALGHPVAFKDAEIDVCNPGMAERHKPVKGYQQVAPSSAVTQDDVRAHLPRDHTQRNSAGQEESPEDHSTAPNDREEEAPSPAHHHKSSPAEAGQYVLGYLVIHARLLGVALDLFHNSIHCRAITRDKVADLTYRIQSWWNKLPMAFQEHMLGDVQRPKSPYSDFFAVAYYHLLLLINRPFLSLPTSRLDFKTSLLAALGASRSIVRNLKDHHEESLVFSWPGTLSATWMSGLVVAFAALLEAYPLEKAIPDLTSCLELLATMSHSWTSARHCRTALAVLRDKLIARQSGGTAHPDLQSDLLRTDDDTVTTTIEASSSPTAGPAMTKTNGRKRRKHRNDNVATSHPQSQHLHVQPSTVAAFGGLLETQNWQPVLQYTGPDFGFDADADETYRDLSGIPSQSLDPDLSGLFSLDGWDAYLQGFGDRLNF